MTGKDSSFLGFSLTPAGVVAASVLCTYDVEQQFTVTLIISAFLVNAFEGKEASYKAKQQPESLVQHSAPRWTYTTSIPVSASLNLRSILYLSHVYTEVNYVAKGYCSKQERHLP